ncbi:translation initiation factor IF-3 [Pelolinea submarina]|uniref:translation initiation factor IF-3 n=1 Tax=Pelolinea submarina TaxID=913107 RepID=UPI000E224143|nr:translation initiation factor IF-3 [Pelolinea submarina]
MKKIRNHKECTISTSSQIKVNANQYIRAPKVRLIDQNGENIGIVPIEKALQIARDAELDLVEIAAGANPPVCKVLDLGKYLFEQNKKERQARKSQTKVEIKEIRLRPKTNEHHRGFKVRDARGWLENGMKVKVTIRFRGREVTYPEIALEDLREIAEDLRDVSTIEMAPSMEGRSMTLVLAPTKAPAKKAAPKEKGPAAEKAEQTEETPEKESEPEK